jgi:hypothetical protein
MRTVGEVIERLGEPSDVTVAAAPARWPVLGRVAARLIRAAGWHRRTSLP